MNGSGAGSKVTMDTPMDDPERVFGTKDHRILISKVADALPLHDSRTVEELQERIADLQKELQSVSADSAVEKLLVETAELNHVVGAAVFSAGLPRDEENKENGGAPAADTRDAGDASSSAHTSLLQSLLDKQRKVNSEYMRKQKEVAGLEKQYEEVAQQNFDLKKRNRELMWALRQHDQRLETAAQQVQGSQACIGLKEELEGHLSRVEVTKNILQALVLGSGVNWAQDPDLLDTVLQCGNSLD